METVKIECPAKINLTLEILDKRKDGYYNIKSVMQMINLYDYITITVEHACQNKIILAGTSEEIPYDNKNLVYKAVELFLKEAKINDSEINIFIEKNIPVSAGLAGGSTDAAGVIYGLNSLLKVFKNNKIEDLCAKLGSDLNVCLQGGCVLATSRGEITQKLPNSDYPVTLIKPKKLGISAGEAYKKYSTKEIKQKNNMTEKMIDAMKQGQDISQFLYNDLEYAVFEDYKELQNIKTFYPKAVMSGSGSTYFVLDNISESKLGKEYLFLNNLHFIRSGVSIVK